MAGSGETSKFYLLHTLAIAVSPAYTECLITVIAKLLNQCILIIPQLLDVHLRHFLAIAFSTMDLTILSLLIFHMFVLFTPFVAIKVGYLFVYTTQLYPFPPKTVQFRHVFMSD